jgi:hypothetical protein
VELLLGILIVDRTDRADIAEIIEVIKTKNENVLANKNSMIYIQLMIGTEKF